MTGQRVAVVVGGSTGIGRGVADAWVRQGAETHVFSRSRPAGPGADALHWHAVDLRDPDRARHVLEAQVPDRVDDVCYSAVYFTARRAPFLQIDESDWYDQFAINVHGLASTLRVTLPLLERRAPGVFLHLSSEVVYHAGPDRAGYAATKAAADSLIRSLAQEIDTDVVRFVQALPEGMVDTPGIRARRASDHDYSGYMSPDSFAPLAVEIARTRGEGLCDAALVVRADSSWCTISQGLPRSQSRRQATA